MMLTWDIYCTEGEEGKEANVSKPKIHFFFAADLRILVLAFETVIITGGGLGIPSGGW